MSKKHHNRAIALRVWQAEKLGTSIRTRKKEDKTIYERIVDVLKLFLG